jgi:hypothetical protein
MPAELIKKMIFVEMIKQSATIFFPGLFELLTCQQKILAKIAIQMKMKSCGGKIIVL